MEMGIKNHKGNVVWTDSGVMGIIKNEKYKPVFRGRRKRRRY